MFHNPPLINNEQQTATMYTVHIHPALMFITHETHRSPISSIFANDGETHWIASELAIDKCWFVLSILIPDRDDQNLKVNKTMLMGTIEHIELAIAQSKNDGFEISSISVVTPDYQNGALHWSMEPLARVWATNGTNSEPGLAILETVSGKRFSDSIFERSIEDLVIGPLRFEVPNI